MKVRPANREDLPAILAIYNDAVMTHTCTADVEPRTLEERTAWYEDRLARDCPVFVAVDAEDTVAGWSSYGPYHGRPGYRYTVENSVYVAADRRGQGVGKLLLPPLIDTAKQSGLHSIVALIDGENEPSLRLHASLGFQHCGRLQQVVRKFDRWLDVVYMQLLLNTE